MKKIIVIIIVGLFFTACSKEKLILEFPKKPILMPRAPDKNPKVAY